MAHPNMGDARQSLKPQPFPRPKIWIFHTLPQTRPSRFQYTISLFALRCFRSVFDLSKKRPKPNLTPEKKFYPISNKMYQETPKPSLKMIKSMPYRAAHSVAPYNTTIPSSPFPLGLMDVFLFHILSQSDIFLLFYLHLK